MKKALSIFMMLVLLASLAVSSIAEEGWEEFTLNGINYLVPSGLTQRKGTTSDVSMHVGKGIITVQVVDRTKELGNAKISADEVYSSLENYASGLNAFDAPENPAFTKTQINGHYAVSGKGYTSINKKIEFVDYVAMWQGKIFFSVIVFSPTLSQAEQASLAKEIANTANSTYTKSTPTPIPTNSPAPTAPPFPVDEYGDFNFKKVARNPENFIGEKVRIEGYATQVSGTRKMGYTIRLATDGQYDDMVYVIVNSWNAPDYNILEGDTLIVYATLQGEETYTSTMMKSVTLPRASADLVELVEED